MDEKTGKNIFKFWEYLALMDITHNTKHKWNNGLGAYITGTE